MTVHFLRSSWIWSDPRARQRKLNKTSRPNCGERLIMPGAAWERRDGGRATVITRQSLCVYLRKIRDFKTCTHCLPDYVTCLTGCAWGLASTLIFASMITEVLQRISSSTFSSCPISLNSIFETVKTPEKSSRVACALIPRTSNLLTVHKLCCNGSWVYFLCSGAGFCALQLSNVPVWNLGSLIFAEIHSSQRIQCELQERGSSSAACFRCLIAQSHLWAIAAWKKTHFNQVESNGCLSQQRKNNPIV